MHVCVVDNLEVLIVMADSKIENKIQVIMLHVLVIYVHSNDKILVEVHMVVEIMHVINVLNFMKDL